MASFLTVVSLIQRDATTVNAELVTSFSGDLLTFLSSNNPTALQAGILALNRTAFGKKVKDVLISCKLPSQGFAGGALSGVKWRDQPDTVTAPIMEQHATIVADFQARLESAGLFDRKVQTEEQKAENKAKRDKKQSESLQAEIDARGLVDPATIPELGINAQLDCVLTLLSANMLDSEQVQTLLQHCITAIGNTDLSKAHAKFMRSLAVSVTVPALVPFPAVPDIIVTV